MAIFNLKIETIDEVLQTIGYIVILINCMLISKIIKVSNMQKKNLHLWSVKINVIILVRFLYIFSKLVF